MAAIDAYMKHSALLWPLLSALGRIVIIFLLSAATAIQHTGAVIMLTPSKYPKVFGNMVKHFVILLLSSNKLFTSNQFVFYVLDIIYY